MAKFPNEDLFEGTKMTFGEHLEELRVVLVRGLVALVLGFLIGLYLADHVVEFIKRPIQDALVRHYGAMAVGKLEELYGDDVPPDVKRIAQSTGFVYQEVYLEREEVARLLSTAQVAAPENTGAGENNPQPQAATATDLESVLQEKLSSPHSNFFKTRLWQYSQARLTTLSPHESFMIWMKAGFVFGLLLASPVMFHQIWIFVAAGLYPHEKHYVYIFLPISLLLFFAGAALAFFAVFGPVLDFLFSFSRSMNIDPDLRLSEVMGFILLLPIGFGVSFQLPLVMLFLNRIGIFNVDAYLEKWRIAILAIFVVSMVLTPADPISMLLMACPLTVLYFLGIAMCKWMPRGRNPFAEGYEP